LASDFASGFASLLASSFLRACEVALVSLSDLKSVFVPAGALQPEHRGGHQLAQSALATARAFLERLVGDLLQYFFVVPQCGHSYS
jgi:hypothetical protein